MKIVFFYWKRCAKLVTHLGQQASVESKSLNSYCNVNKEHPENWIDRHYWGNIGK